MKYNIIVIIVIVILFSTLGLVIRTKIDDTNEATASYNNGICTECGGEYHFSGADRSRYYYTCAECDHTICAYKLMK